MLLFRATSSSTFIMSDVQSIYIPSSIRDWYLERKTWTTDRQYSFCMWILWTKNTRILERSTWMHRVLHNTCTKHGRNIKIRCIGSTSTLLWIEDWSSIRHDRTPSFFTKHSQLIVSRKLFGWKLEKSSTRKYVSHPGPPPKISLKHDWLKELGSEVARQPQEEVARQAKGSQSNPNPNHDRTGRPVVCRDMNRGRSMLNEVDIDFRIPGLPHSVVKQAENYRVRELVKKIENHPDRHALQQNLRQNKAYNPFSAESKCMIQDVGNVELFELFETDPKTQCKECLFYWSQGIVHCTCGHLLKENEASRGSILFTLALLSIPNYVIKKGRPHGHRYGKTLQQREHHQAHNLKQRCIKRHFKWIHDRFLKDAEFRASQLEHDRNEEVCIQMDELEQKDFSYHMTQAEYFRYRQNWWISLNKSGKIGPVRDRSDFNDALTTLNRLHQESGERQLKPVPFWKYQYWHQSSSYSSSWWQWSDSWWSS